MALVWWSWSSQGLKNEKTQEMSPPYRMTKHGQHNVTAPAHINMTRANAKGLVLCTVNIGQS